jgi:mRNA-degrading endonuclease RelE of RelBE toxin-antitoxin system
MYSVYLKPKAIKDFDALNAKYQKRMLGTLETLSLKIHL